ncbi:MAG TPA: hypothetical protein VIU65_10695 [Pyrinomonadaceae bacterium]
MHAEFLRKLIPDSKPAHHTKNYPETRNTATLAVRITVAPDQSGKYNCRHNFPFSTLVAIIRFACELSSFIDSAMTTEAAQITHHRVSFNS